MNIVFVTHYPGKGGANNEMLLLIEELLKNGHHITVVMPSDGWLYSKVRNRCDVLITSYHRWVEESGSSLIKKSVSKFAKYVINWKAAHYLADKLRYKNVDLIHTNDSLTVVGAYLAYLLKVPHVWHIREIFDGQFDFKHTFSEAYCKKWLNKANAVIAISKAVYDRYQQYDLNNLTMIYDGINYKPVSKTEKTSRREDVFTMLFCGGTSLDKGFNDVVNLATKLVKGGVPDFIIKIVASSNLTDQLIHQLKNNGIYDKFQFLGFVDNLNEIRNTCDVMLMCSKDEAFGLVTVESMMYKLPVIGRNSGATSEILKDGITGFLYNNADELYQKVIFAMHSDLADIKHNAFAYARNNFDITTTAQKVEALYMSIASHHGELVNECDGSRKGQ